MVHAVGACDDPHDRAVAPRGRAAAAGATGAGARHVRGLRTARPRDWGGERALAPWGVRTPMGGRQRVERLGGVRDDFSRRLAGRLGRSKRVLATWRKRT